MSDQRSQHGVSLGVPFSPHLFRKTKIQVIVPLSYDHGSPTILRVEVIVQPQLKVMCTVATHPSSQDYERAPGLSSKDDDGLGHAANRDDCR